MNMYIKKQANISESEGEELGVGGHVEDAKSGWDCRHNEDPQKQPEKNTIKSNFLQHLKFCEN